MVRAESDCVRSGLILRYRNRSQPPGFGKLLKFRKANVGDPHARCNYQLAQTFASEELREKPTIHPGH